MSSTPHAANAPAPHPQKVVLVNKRYWQEINALLKNLPAPKVRDYLEIMQNKGNLDYFEGFPNLKPQQKQAVFAPSYVRHEITHICGQFGHTPQQEFFGLAFEIGLSAGVAVRNTDTVDRVRFLNKITDSEKLYRKNMKRYTDTTPVPTSARDWAVYCAAGMYLREKVDIYYQQHGFQPYGVQKQFCDHYADAAHDAEPINLSAAYSQHYDKREYFDAIMHAPANLITLTPQEWKAITSVALGLCEPEHTPYPKRLGAIKDALVHTGLFFDKPKFAEQMRAQQMATSPHNGAGR